MLVELLETTRTHPPPHLPKTHTHPSLKHNECYEQSHTAHEQKQQEETQETKLEK